MIKKIFLSAIALMFVSAGVAYAAGDSSSGSGVGILDAAENAGIEIECPEGVPNRADDSDYSTEGAQDFVLQILGNLLNFVALLAVVMLVVVGIRLVIAMGNQEALQGAKKQALWVFGGLAIIILSLLIVKNVVEKVYETTQTPEEPDTTAASETNSGDDGSADDSSKADSGDKDTTQGTDTAADKADDEGTTANSASTTDTGSSADTTNTDDSGSGSDTDSTSSGDSSNTVSIGNTDLQRQADGSYQSEDGGTNYKGDIVNGQMDGQGTLTYSAGENTRQSEGTFVDGKFWKGDTKTYDSNGKLVGEASVSGGQTTSNNTYDLDDSGNYTGVSKYTQPTGAPIEEGGGTNYYKCTSGCSTSNPTYNLCSNPTEKCY